jgi:hypothetical protein
LSNKDVKFGLGANEKTNGVVFGSSFNVTPLFACRHSEHFLQHAGVSDEDTAGEFVERLTNLARDKNWVA